jgi:predicted ATPase
VPEVTIDLLAGFRAAVDGVPVPEEAWRLKKARDLVKLLALAPGHRLHKEQAMDVLWPDRDPRSAANNLYQAVHVARRALGTQAIEFNQEVLRLEADVDVDRFEQALAEARGAGTPGAFRAALALYRGELLPENRYDDWAAERRDTLFEAHAELVGAAAAMDFAGGFRALPASVNSFVGREDELAELRRLLGGARLLTLTGTGGAGKTRLALELTRSVQSSFEHGVALVELATVSDPLRVAEAVAAALDVRPLPGETAEEAAVRLLAPRSLLLVLDNCEHVLSGSAAFAGAALRGAGGLTILATSREPLHAAGEVVFRVPSLAAPDPEEDLSPEELLGFEAVLLFVERARAAAGDFALDEAKTNAAVARICSRLDGLPLALELAAGRVAALGAESLAARLDDRFRLLRAGGGGSPTRQQTLEAALAWSHELLELPEQVLFRRLAVFAGGFDLDAAEAVCPDDSLDAGEVADALGRLVEKSLVSAEVLGSERRYSLLETVRLYASQRLEEAHEAESLGARHADWALALAERIGDSPRLDRESANLTAALDTLLAQAPADALRMCVALWPYWLRRIDLEEANRRFADALERAPERTALRCRALLAAGALVLRSGRLALGEEYARAGIELARELGDVGAEWRALHFLGVTSVSRDDAEGAVERFTQALELAERYRLAALAALCVYSLGVARWRLGELPLGEELVAEAIERFRAIGCSDERVPSLPSVGESHGIGLEDLEPRIVFEDTLHPFVDVSCDAAIGYALANQAGIARSRGDLERARSLLAESLERFERTADERGQADALLRLGYLELADGSPAAAGASLERALELRRRQDDRRGVGMALSGLGLVDTVAGNYDLAEQRLAEACDLFRRAGDRWGLTGALWNTADLAIARRDFDAARASLEEALAVLRETGRELWIAQTRARLDETAALQASSAG